MSNTREIVDMELEAIKAIYLDDITIESKDDCHQYMAYILVNVLPATADNKSHQLVRLSLAISLPHLYPKESPVFEFHNTRGLNDNKIDIIKESIGIVCKERLGETLLYDVIEKCRELLTSFNFPNGNRCAICLYEFAIKDQIVKNECFHHLHSRCLVDYIIFIKNSNKDTQQIETNNGIKSQCLVNDIIVQCPVCRINLDISDIYSNIDPNKYALPYLSNEPLKDELLIIEEAKHNVLKFNEIYLKQLQKGGIIDEEAEKYKFFIRISEHNSETSIT